MLPEVSDTNGLNASTRWAASTFPVGLNMTKTLIRIFVNKCVRLIDILRIHQATIILTEIILSHRE